MTWVKTLCITILFLSSPIFLMGQTLDVLGFEDIMDPVDTRKKYTMAKNNHTLTEITFSSLFLFYKTTFSSQDGTRCNFHPSCSEYGLLSVKKYGLFPGMLSTFDRLTRCNGLAPEKYEYDPKMDLLIDQP